MLSVTRVLLLLAGLAASVGCNSERAQQEKCAKSHPHPILGACVGSSSMKQRVEGGDSLELSGTVIDMGSGPLPAGCTDGGGIPIGRTWDASGNPATGPWLTVENAAGERATVGVIAPDFAFGVARGDVISVDFFSKQGSWSPSVSHLLVRRADGTLVSWLSFGGQLSDLEPPRELSIAAGPVTCTASDSCISAWTLSALKVTSSAETKEIAYGAKAKLGDLAVVHGGLDKQTSDGTKCPDAFVAWAAVAAWRR